MMDWRLYTPGDHDMVAGWWRAWDWRVLPPESLGKLGVIALDSGRPVACAWLYRSDSCVAMIGFFVTDKSVSARKRSNGIKTVVHVLTDIANDNGYTTVFATVLKNGLAKAIESQGFTYREENNINLFKVIDNGR